SFEGGLHHGLGPLRGRLSGGARILIEVLSHGESPMGPEHTLASRIGSISSMKRPGSIPRYCFAPALDAARALRHIAAAANQGRNTGAEESQFSPCLSASSPGGTGPLWGPCSISAAEEPSWAKTSKAIAITRSAGRAS